MAENSDENIRIQYDLLSILDSKSSALLTFNGMFLAAISVWLGYVPLNYLHLILDIVFIAILISCVLLLMVIWIKWSAKGEGAEILMISRERRTRYYKWSWYFSGISVLTVVIVSILHAVGTFCAATGSECASFGIFFSDQVFGNLDARSTAGG